MAIIYKNKEINNKNVKEVHHLIRVKKIIKIMKCLNVGKLREIGSINLESWKMLSS